MDDLLDVGILYFLCLALVVLVDRLEPADVVMAVRHNVNGQVPAPVAETVFQLAIEPSLVPVPLVAHQSLIPFVRRIVVPVEEVLDRRS